MNESWLATFRDDPNQAVADLISGRAGTHVHAQLDMPELLYHTFPQHRPDDRRRLDAALRDWMLNMQSEHAEQIGKLGSSVLAKRLVDALAAIHLLDLPISREHVRSHLDEWLRWLEPLRLAPDRDPALECWRVISRNQPDTGHLAAWIRLADDPRPEYFGVAWVGLKRLPNQANARRNQVLMVHAAIRHAATSSHDIGTARRSFNRRLAALRGMFPRSQQHWRSVLLEATQIIIDGETQRHGTQSEGRFLVDLTRKLRPSSATSKPRSPASARRVQSPGQKAEFNKLLGDIELSDSLGSLAERLFNLSKHNLRYAEVTGESYYFVRTLNNLGTRILRRFMLSDEELTTLGYLTERALAWEPGNPFSWMLWADWFAACENPLAREWTLREMARLFPSNEHCRVELSRLLIANDDEHWHEADHWLRQAVERNPEGLHSRVELARLLAQRSHVAEARKLLHEVLAKDPSNPAATYVLEAIGRQPVEPGPNERPIPLRVRPVREGPLADEIARRGKLAGEFNRIKFAGDKRAGGATPLIVEQSAKGDSLAGFYAQWLKLSGVPQCPPHAWAWNACRHWQDQPALDRWDQLAARFPEAAMETVFLRVLAAGATTDDHGRRRASNAGYERHNAATTLTAGFIRDMMPRLDELNGDQREELALAVLASRAAPPLEFTGAI